MSVELWCRKLGYEPAQKLFEARKIWTTDDNSAINAGRLVFKSAFTAGIETSMNLYFLKYLHMLYMLNIYIQ